MLTDNQKERVLKGMTYTEYSSFTLELTEKYKSENNPKCELLKLNYSRSSRIEKTFVPGEELTGLVQEISRPQTWLILSESWCADSAQNIPYFAAAAALNPLINLRILLRDENPDIMDNYLTNSSRSIPMVVLFDEDFNELARWGSRPKSAVVLINGWKSQGLSKEEWNLKLHSWYALNKGKEVVSEICEILRSVLAPEIL